MIKKILLTLAFVILIYSIDTMAQEVRPPAVKYVITEIVDQNSAGEESKPSGLSVDLKNECDKQGRSGFELVSIFPSKKTTASTFGDIKEQNIYILIFKKAIRLEKEKVGNVKN